MRQNAYPAGIQTWLVAGPFDFTGIKNGIVSFDLFYEANKGDHFIFSTSEDKIAFDPKLIIDKNVDPGEGVWQRTIIVLEPYAGKPQVWLAFSFESAFSSKQKRPLPFGSGRFFKRRREIFTTLFG